MPAELLPAPKPLSLQLVSCIVGRIAESMRCARASQCTHPCLATQLVAAWAVDESTLDPTPAPTTAISEKQRCFLPCSDQARGLQSPDAKPFGSVGIVQHAIRKDTRCGVWLQTNINLRSVYVTCVDPDAENCHNTRQ